MSTTFNADTGGIGGHPRGLTTLFFTEFWERFSYYGMRAILTLFMVAKVTDGGLGLDVATAAAIYGFYTAAVFFMGIPGGWIADRLLGQRNAVLYGGILIAMGHYSLAIDSKASCIPQTTIGAMRVFRSSTWGSTWAPSSRRWCVEPWLSGSVGTGDLERREWG